MRAAKKFIRLNTSKEQEVIIKPFTIEHLDAVYELANELDYIAPNTRMMYYLFATLYSQYSYIALYNNEVVGYLLTMSKQNGDVLWFHQIGVSNKLTRKGIASKLLKSVMDDVRKDAIMECQLAIKSGNLGSERLASGFGFSFSHYDENIKMNIHTVCQKIALKKMA